MRLSPHPARAGPSGLITQGPTIRSTRNESSAGPLTAAMTAVSSWSIGSGVVVFRVPPDHVSALSGRITRIRIRLVIRDDREEGATALSRFPAAFRPPAFVSWSSCSRRGVELSSRSPDRTHRIRTPTGLRAPRARATTGVGDPSTPRTAVLALTGVARRRWPCRPCREADIRSLTQVEQSVTVSL